MKKFNMLLCAVFFATQIFSQTISDFENLTLAADTFWDGSDLTGGFSSGNAQFVNDYNTSFFSWNGFTYSNKTDSTTAGYGNQYSAITGGGYGGSSKYSVANEYGNTKILLTGNAAGKPVEGFYVTNTTYAYLSMKNGDSFSKKFGGTSGSDPDWFLLKVMGWSNGALKAQSVEFYLADYRSADSTQDYIVRDWTWLNLQSLGDVDSLLFDLTSSDTGQFGMNTPAYFAVDNFTTSDVANAAPTAADDEVTTTYLNDTLIDVLANDADATALPLTVELLGSPLISGATAVVTGTQILYTPAIGIVATDTLTYRVCDGGGLCATARVTVRVTGITAIDELADSGLRFSLYPNPFSNQLSILNVDDNTIQSFEMVVYDATGRIVLNERALNANTALETSNWNTGVYFLKISNGTNTVFKKVVKQ